ncbi:MAG: hypothetical protein DWQ05_11535 [Calditrichaeota bacterium]|nr:MAG: hypothetical protein DWQ05_11535 [Calditrichota bacterium]
MESREIIGIVGLFVNILLPVVLVFIGRRINASIKEIEHSHWANQKVIEKKLQLFDQIAPKLNDLYCFYLFIGRWKEITPADAIQLKRDLDRLVYTYQMILGNDLVEKYKFFMDKIAFHVYNKAGENARIIGEISNKLGDRKTHADYEWLEVWDEAFYTESEFDSEIFKSEYFCVLGAFQKSLGLGID